MFFLSFLMYHDLRLPRTQLGSQSMHWISTSGTSSAHPLHFSSTPCMIHSERELISSVATLSASARVHPPLFLMVSGSTSLTMMHPHSLWSPLRETLGAHLYFMHKRILKLFKLQYHILSTMLAMVRYVDAVMTIPKGTLFPMCGMNLAFDRELIGPAMYFGLMGEGQPIGRYDDMWAGWCTKVLHLPNHSYLSPSLRHSVSNYHFRHQKYGLYCQLIYTFGCPITIEYVLFLTVATFNTANGVGDMWSFEFGDQDWSSLHLPQQSKQSICELEEGI